MGCPASGVAHSAYRTDVEVVCGQRCKAVDDHGVRIGGEQGAFCRAAEVALRAVLNLPFGGWRDVNPVKRDAGGGGIGGINRGGDMAGGNKVERYVVDTGIPETCVAQRHDGCKTAVAGVV